MQFIVIEGLDGTGKSTVAQGLATALCARPMNTPGVALRNVRADVLKGLGDHQLARCLFYAATVLSRGEEARRLADEGTSVVMDRYWLSTLAYARARGVDVDLSAIAARVPKPDRTILLTLDEDVRQARMTSRGLTIADRETMDRGFRDTVLQVMRNSGRVDVEVDVTGLSREEVVQAVMSELQHAPG